MSIVVIVEITAQPGKLATMVDMVAAILPETRKQPGCQSMELHADEARPDDLIAIEEWSDRPSYDAYLNMRIETGLMNDIMQLAQGEPSIRYLTRVEY